MIYISHRGNINGRIVKEENNPDYILNAIDKKYDVEIDVWYNHGWYLGHDEPQYKVDIDFIQKKGLWIHAKNIKAAEELNGKDVNWFWHNKDFMTITSKGYVWCYPGKEIKNCILNDFGQNFSLKKIVSGICSDNIENWKNS